MFRSCKSSVPARSSFDKFKARPGPKCWYPSPPEARKVQKMEGSSPPEARKTEARHITNYYSLEPFRNHTTTPDGRRAAVRRTTENTKSY